MAARSRRICTLRYSTLAVFAFSASSTRFTAVRSLERAARLRAFASRLNRTRFFALLRFGNSALSTLWLLAHASFSDQLKVQRKVKYRRNQRTHQEPCG